MCKAAALLSSGPCTISEAVACDSDGFLFHSDLLLPTLVCHSLGFECFFLNFALFGISSDVASLKHYRGEAILQQNFLSAILIQKMLVSVQ